MHATGRVVPEALWQTKRAADGDYRSTANEQVDSRRHAVDYQKVHVVWNCPSSDALAQIGSLISGEFSSSLR